MGLGSWLARRKRGYSAAWRIEQYRAAAEQLRAEDPDMYWEIVAQADGSPAEDSARQEPDAYVALFLAEAEKRGVLTSD